MANAIDEAKVCFFLIFVFTLEIGMTFIWPTLDDLSKPTFYHDEKKTEAGKKTAKPRALDLWKGPYQSFKDTRGDKSRVYPGGSSITEREGFLVTRWLTLKALHINPDSPLWYPTEQSNSLIVETYQSTWVLQISIWIWICHREKICLRCHYVLYGFFPCQMSRSICWSGGPMLFDESHLFSWSTALWDIIIDCQDL